MSRINSIVRISIVIIILSSISHTLVSGQTNAKWITNIEIKEAETGKIIGVDDLLLTGRLYEVHVEITMPLSAEIEVVAETQLEWDEVGSLWNVIEGAGAIKFTDPQQNIISFTPKAKDAKLVLFIRGRAPRDITMKRVDDLILHYTTNINLIFLNVKDGSPLESIEKMVVDSWILDFNNKVEEKKVFLDEIKDEANEKWFSLTSSLVGYSESMANNGFTDMASQILDLIPSSRDSVPLKPVQQDFLMANISYLGIGVLGILAVIGMVQWSRNRSKNSIFEDVLKDQVKRLEVLRVRGERIDRRFASDLEELKDTVKKVLEGE
ncbi:MAG: hypothetical protein GTO54_12755 [Nitrososphaeria archaeon]|nr:hypothetical protein [Nitrososphaeria archaeon]